MLKDPFVKRDPFVFIPPSSEVIPISQFFYKNSVRFDNLSGFAAKGEGCESKNQNPCDKSINGDLIVEYITASER